MFGYAQILDTFGYFWIRLDTRAMFGIPWKLFRILLDAYGYASVGRAFANKSTVRLTWKLSPHQVWAGALALALQWGGPGGARVYVSIFSCAPTSGDILSGDNGLGQFRRTFALGES